MPIYEHSCRGCGKDWLEEYNLEQYDWLKENNIALSCPNCDSEDTFRCINHVPVHFKGGGWSPDGYYDFNGYDQLQAEGKKVTRFDDRDDLKRVMKGEKAEATKARLKREDELAKKYFGPDAALTEEKANARIKKAVDKVQA